MDRSLPIKPRSPNGLLGSVEVDTNARHIGQQHVVERNHEIELDSLSLFFCFLSRVLSSQIEFSYRSTPGMELPGIVTRCHCPSGFD